MAAADTQSGPRPASQGAGEDRWVREARALVHDLFRPRAWIYWSDWLLSLGGGVACFATAFRMPVWLPDSPWRLPLQTLCLLACCLLLYRSAMFIHEIAHLGNKRELRGFRLVWNLFCGCPLQVPAFMYDPHLDHHRRQTFGTEEDGEYIPFEKLSPWALAAALAASVIIPPAVVLRFLVIGPVSWLIPPLRREVLERMSTLAIDPTYRRPAPKPGEAWAIFWQELLCFAYLLGFIALAWRLGTEGAVRLLGLGYSVAITINFINLLRTIGSHRFDHDGRTMSHTEQLLDSVNCTGPRWITELWGPVGARLHALHHLFPSLPYHAYGEAHRRLSEKLPPDSPYHEASQPALLTAVLDLWRRTHKA